MAAAQPADRISHPAPQRHKAPAWLVGAGLLLAPAAWILQLNTSWLLGEAACASGDAAPAPNAMLLSGAVVALALALVALAAAARSWFLTRGEGAGGREDALTSGHGRTRFMALCGVIVSAIFTLAIAFSVAIPFVVQRCAG